MARIAFTRLRSRSKTAFGLLSEIARLIKAEPKRYNQTDTLRIGKPGESVYGTNSWDYAADPNSVEKFPRCGTIGCVAGWVTALKARSPKSVDVLDFAEKKLGLDRYQADELFSGGAADGAPQTRTHALNGVRHIRKFQKRYAKQLKAKRV